LSNLCVLCYSHYKIAVLGSCPKLLLLFIIVYCSKQYFKQNRPSIFYSIRLCIVNISFLMREYLFHLKTIFNLSHSGCIYYTLPSQYGNIFFVDPTMHSTYFWSNNEGIRVNNSRIYVGRTQQEFGVPVLQI